MPTDVEEVVRAAIQLEVDGRAFYLEAAEKASSGLARRTFVALADDELRHIEYIRAVSPGTDTLRTANERVYARLRGIFADVPEAERQAFASAPSDTQALSMAIEIEERSRLAYQTWSREADAEEMRGLCELLTAAELFHRQLLENVIEYLDHPHDFFLREERWFVEG